MKKLDGLKIALCQMPVVPGKPDVNAAYMIEEIKKADERGVDIIAFPEMCVPGYLIGDLFEDDAFVRDVHYWNKAIFNSTKGLNVAVIFGSLMLSDQMKGEDGRIRKSNHAFVAQNGLLGGSGKTLQPNYRMFDDDRHFYSQRKYYEEWEHDMHQAKLAFNYTGPENDLQPIVIHAKNSFFKIGVILCEDMWHEDYAFNPTKGLVDNGAEIIFNLSASPWSWRKNQKRHSVVKKLLAECKVPFAYVNNTGIQNNGKNIIVFDGSSTVYNPQGDIVFAVPPYEKGSRDLEFKKNLPIIKKNGQNDTFELYQAERCVLYKFFGSFPAHMRKVVIGLSGGIDSALDAALLVDVLGPKNVFAYTMPSKYTSVETLNLAKQIAANLGIEIEVIPIQEIVDSIARTTGCEPDTLAYENIQARMRMEILAAKMQKLGGLFIGNSNKVEIAFSYGTQYGDIAGCLLPIGDLVKREVYQLADYMNQVVFQKKVIPQKCFDIAPSAELKKNQKDPFDYGNLHRRGYHDEMVRALVEFRKNPEWFLDLYVQGKLEAELKLEEGTLKKLFPETKDFIADLERCWNLFHISVFKQVQAPPIPIVSKRAFGYDLRRSMLPANFTQRYQALKSKLLEKT